MSNILIGVCGGIAAYKTPAIARLLIKRGHSVKFMMTEEACKFIGHVTLAAISGNKVIHPEAKDDSMIGHIELAKWAEICLIAPATANTIGKYASGIADSCFLSTLLALECPLVIAPAMNCNMLAHPAVKSNIEKIKGWGAYIIDPEEGFLACGDSGKGRMKDSEYIADIVCDVLADKANTLKKEIYPLSEIRNSCVDDTSEGYNKESLPLEGLRFLITAGPTREYIDPVRYISNRSSGKMGNAIAEAALEMGADVTLISGEANIISKVPNIISVVSCADMEQAVEERVSDCDILIMAAAVADYSVKEIALEKIKKNDSTFVLELVKTVDILKKCSNFKKKGQIFIGFAAETENLEENAIKKLNEKNLDIIVANDVARRDIGFDSDFNDVKLFFKDGRISETGRRLKKDIARIIVTEGAILAKGGE